MTQAGDSRGEKFRDPKIIGIRLKTLLLAKAAAEGLTGLALVLVPAFVVSLLLGSPLDARTGAVVARIAGVALLTLGTACWLARNHGNSGAAAGLIMALLFYDAAVVVIFLFARFAMGMSGIALWPAVVLHAGLGVWSVLCLRRVRGVLQ